jgi:DNA-binding XRE family transcriptional regulator
MNQSCGSFEKYKLFCSWCFCTYNTTNQSVPNQEQFFRALGTKVRELRKKRGYSQEDMISFGFSARHFQQIEAGRPITVTAMLRLCEVLETSVDKLVKGLDPEFTRSLFRSESCPVGSGASDDA